MNTDAEHILDKIAEDLRTHLSAKYNAVITVAEDPAHAVDILSAGRPGGMAVVVFYNGDDNASDEDLDTDTVVDGYIRVAVASHVGMKIKTGAKSPSSLKAATLVRRFLAGRDIDGCLMRLTYRGSTTITNNGTLLQGYVQTYSAVYAFK